MRPHDHSRKYTGPALKGLILCTYVAQFIAILFICYTHQCTHTHLPTTHPSNTYKHLPKLSKNGKGGKKHSKKKEEK